MIQQTHGSVTLFLFHNLALQTGLVHAISSRLGGVSTEPYDTLNLSSSVGDHPASVDTNRKRFAAAVGVSTDVIRTARQVHGRQVWDVGTPQTRPVEADILLVDRPAVFASQRFADCVPILLWDRVNRKAAAAHAGWRGTALNVAGAAVEALGRSYGSRPRDLLAGIGPGIGPCCYEVGPEVTSLFGQRTEWLRPSREDRSMLDLLEANRQALVEAGMDQANIELAEICTRCSQSIFFSHRGSGGLTGRFASIIGYTKP